MPDPGFGIGQLLRFAIKETTRAVVGWSAFKARRLYHQPLIINNEENEQLMVMEELDAGRQASLDAPFFSPTRSPGPTV